MGTSAIIAKQLEDGSFKQIYVNYDGYPSYMLEILNSHYVKEEDLDRLLALGDLSFLDKSTEAPEGHTFLNPVKGHCISYGRDRGEKKCEAQTHFRVLRGTNYAYIWRNGIWNYRIND